MIIHLRKFIETERPYWHALTEMVDAFEADPYRQLAFSDIKRLHYLYQRASADLVKISTFSAEKQIRDFLETLVGRSYAMIHSSGRKANRFRPLLWLGAVFPRTVRRHRRALALSAAAMLVGGFLGAAALVADQDAKDVLMPFEHLQMDPATRVAEEETTDGPHRLAGSKGRFSAFLVTHNTRVSILVLALGMTWGVGTLLVLFSNGVLLGAVVADYVVSGQTPFLLGWLLPHGAVEIPAVLVAGQAGFVLAGALMGRGKAYGLRDRLAEVRGDVVTLIAGVAVMLVWAGIVEAFFSQYHEPVLPYAAKIAFGVTECVLLMLLFATGGRRSMDRADPLPTACPLSDGR